MSFLDPKEQLRLLKKGVVDLISEKELLDKLYKSFKENKPLRIKAGFDPSRPDLHIGHTVLINKMKQFQDLGHTAIFLIGDFTACIGDPTGKNETRPALTQEEVKENSKTYAEQVFKILDPKKTEVQYNGTWMNKFTPIDFIKLAGQYTVSRMIERDDFKTRFQEHKPISIHEFLYPLVQGYDSVALKSDVELGGTDQRFNLLVGREIQKAYGVEQQCIMTTPILEGLDGVKKMSKSYDNYIGVQENPKDMFGKTLRVSDELMFRYYELLTDLTLDQIEALKADMKSGKVHPKKVKVDLARTLVERFHSKDAADKAEKEFETVFVNKGLPTDIPEFKMSFTDAIGICQLMTNVGLTASNSEARRLIEGKAVEFDGAKKIDPKEQILLKKGSTTTVKAGKHKFVKIVVE
jgi:tyrosyl-tRNA synthetase